MLLASCAAVLPAPVTASDQVIRFREAWGWAIVVPVEVGGSGVHEFLVDTGATFTVLEPALAAELGLAPAARATVVTLTGERAVGAGRADLTLGRTRLADVEVRIADLPAIRSDEPRIRGLLGQSALSQLEYTIDHARRRLVVHRGHSEGSSLGSPPRPTLEARVGCGPSSTRFVLDSGINAPVLFRHGGRPPDVELGGPIRASTNAGDAVWQEGRLSSLCVAGRRADQLPVVVRPESTPARAEGGLLPTRFFARVRLGVAGGVVRVDHW